jgi:flotillin
MGAGLLLLILGAVMMFSPFFIPNQSAMPDFAKGIVVVLGSALAFVGVAVMVITKLYRKAAADKAFVRTGMRSKLVIIDGGCLVIPVVHDVIPVSLNTMRIDINRRGADALITGDKLRADIDAEFYIRVLAETPDVLAAARSLGNKSVETRNVTDLVQQKLISALRTVAAKSPLEALNSNREQFAEDVANAVREDLKQNGLTLEAVTVSMLDQTDIEHLKTENVFDAEGRMRIAQITSANAIRENEARRDAESQIADKDRKTREAVAEQEFLQAQANARRDANIVKAQAEQNREAEVFSAEQHRETENAKLAANQAIGERDAERDRQVRLAQIDANRQAQTADVQREQAVEVAKREQQVAVAKAETSRSLAMAEQLKADQEREAENQGVQTVAAVQEADRVKQVRVIEAQQSAEVKRVDGYMQADITAYELEKVATGQLRAAEQEANARRIRAEAEREALTAEADGQSKVASVPVNVKAREVEVDSQRVETVDRPSVEVLQARLKAQNEFTEVSVKLEIAKAIIEANRDVGVANAQAMGQALGNADMKFFGNPELLDAFVKRFATGQGVNGLLEGLGLEGIDDISKLLEKVPALKDLAGQLGRLTGAKKPKAGAAEAAE